MHIHIRRELTTKLSKYFQDISLSLSSPSLSLSLNRERLMERSVLAYSDTRYHWREEGGGRKKERRERMERRLLPSFLEGNLTF